MPQGFEPSCTSNTCNMPTPKTRAFSRTHGGEYQATAMLRLPQVIEITGLKRSTIYHRIKSGMFPPPVKDGARISVWLAAEIETLNAAKATGSTEEGIKYLVKSILRKRSELNHLA